MIKNIALFGSTGSIGNALLDCFLAKEDVCIHTFSRQKIKKDYHHTIDITNEKSIQAACEELGETPFDLVIVATGSLHTENYMPEKTYKQFNQKQLEEMFLVNTIGPAIIAKYMLPRLRPNALSTFAALSARVASISDNRIGGWTSYRASKAALNMVIKNLAIEQKRIDPNHIIVGIHPGTVHSALSAPFKNAPYTFFSPEKSANYLDTVLQQLTPEDSGNCYDWNGKIVLP